MVLIMVVKVLDNVQNIFINNTTVTMVTLYDEDGGIDCVDVTQNTNEVFKNML